jgi:hypothetical protein
MVPDKAHETAYSIHTGSEKMYQDLKKKFWWYGMKREIAEHVVVCDSCQRIKAEHQKPARLLQPLRILQWKWDEIRMKLHSRIASHSSRLRFHLGSGGPLNQVSHFIPVKTRYNSAVLAELYMSRVVCLHGVPKKIVSDRGTQFISHFW